MDITQGEALYLEGIARKLESIRNFVETYTLDVKSLDPSYWYDHTTKLKRILGNFDNDISFVACLMAKEFLMLKHDIDEFDVSVKPQSAPGLDIEETSSSGERVIGEIKTTIPYQRDDLGANQKKSFIRDFEKLAGTEADHKYFFVTVHRTFEIVKQRYVDRLGGVTLVLLPHCLREVDRHEFIIEVPQEGSNVFSASTTSSPEHHPNHHKGTRRGALADSIRNFILEEFVLPARESGNREITIRSGDIHISMNLRNRYPAVCGAMRSSKFEKLADVKMIRTEGKDGARYSVTYAL